jgi:hypothetical protein
MVPMFEGCHAMGQRFGQLFSPRQHHLTDPIPVRDCVFGIVLTDHLNAHFAGSLPGGEPFAVAKTAPEKKCVLSGGFVRMYR